MTAHNGRPDFDEAATIGLRALAWTLGDADVAARMIATTGLDIGDLRARAGEPALLAAVLSFLEAYQPNLIACAEALDMNPSQLVAARILLEH
ncbi:DUF3572 family protein [Sphingomonas sp. MMS24-J13]|uniref:DUF3572 family protein n=1 Tax=Sphingomonas sp. MMS24-J13 TaxID=3238686 RepID=UPI00384C315E